MPGRHLLLLCGKSRQKRIKGGKETVRSGFPPSFENLLPFDRIADRLRTASVRGLTFSIALGSLRDAGIFELKRQRRGNYAVLSYL